MPHKKNTQKFLWIAVVLLLLSACGTQKSADQLLDPDHPVTVILWNYYNGATKSSFDQLVSQFNHSVGMEQGIIVDSISHGDINQLAESVYDAANHKLGAETMPDLFAAYPDNAYRVDQLGQVVDLGLYFTEEQLEAYPDFFLQDCRFGAEGALKVLPTVRSTEVLYLNRTDWDKFASETQAELENLSTWEGIAHTAQQYYAWTDAQTETPDDGNAFLGIDTIATFIIEASMQLDTPLYHVEDGAVGLQFDEPFAKIIWENLYLPYLNGFYKNYGAFRSDDAKTGHVLAYIGTSAGAGYFPSSVTLGPNNSYEIKNTVLPYPYFSGGTPFAILQGAGFSISKSDPTHEYAASLFLSWLTEQENNVQFALASGYLPVTKAALATDLVGQAEALSQTPANQSAVRAALQTTTDMLNRYQFYANPSFEGSFDLRQLLNESLMDTINHDLTRVEQAVQSGVPREEAMAPYLDEAHFHAWYQDFMAKATNILSEKN